MNFSVEQLLIALLLILPGFVTTLLQRVFHPKQFDTGLEWSAVSLLRSVFLNALVLGLAALAGGLLPDLTTLGELSLAIKMTSIGNFAIYCLFLYFLAGMWGIILGRYPIITPQYWARRWNWTTVTRFTSIWNQIHATRLDKDANMKPWMRFKLQDGRDVLGRLLDSSVFVDRDKPVEIFMYPVYEITTQGLVEIRGVQNLEFKGIYFRLEPEMPMDFYVAGVDWRPSGDSIVFHNYSGGLRGQVYD